MHLNVALCANTGGEDAVCTEDIQRTLEGYRKIRTMVVKGEPGDWGGGDTGLGQGWEGGFS